MDYRQSLLPLLFGITIIVVDASRRFFPIKIKHVEKPIKYEESVEDTEFDFKPIRDPADPYGPLSEYASSLGCITNTSDLYGTDTVVTVCLFKNITMKEGEREKKFMGTWKEWKIESRRYSAMIYNDGEICDTISERFRFKIVIRPAGPDLIQPALIDLLEFDECTYEMTLLAPLTKKMLEVPLDYENSNKHKAGDDEDEDEYQEDDGDDSDFDGDISMLNEANVSSGATSTMSMDKNPRPVNAQIDENLDTSACKNTVDLSPILDITTSIQDEVSKVRNEIEGCSNDRADSHARIIYESATKVLSSVINLLGNVLEIATRVPDKDTTFVS